LGRTPTFDETYLPREIREKVWDNDLEVEPIFALLENRYDTPLVEAEYKLEAAAAHQRRDETAAPIEDRSPGVKGQCLDRQHLLTSVAIRGPAPPAP
jgi:hypothetical protein